MKNEDISLFDKNEGYTQYATELDIDTKKQIRKLFKKYKTLGFKAREISYIMRASIVDIELSSILGWE